MKNKMISQTSVTVNLESNRRPLNTLMRNLNNMIIVKLKNNLSYKGRMIKCDTYMNMLLEGASEFDDENLIANYGNVFIRGNNILYVCVNASKLP